MNTTYLPPVNKLLELDMPDIYKFDWPHYLTIGFSKKDIPELIRMATDKKLFIYDESDSSVFYAPIHAWRVLGQLKAEAAIESLIGLFLPYKDMDWVGEELPIVMEMIGPAALPYLDNYLESPEHGDFPRVTAVHSIEKIGNKYSEVHSECKDIIIRHLKNYENHPEILNAFLISYLIDLDAKEALPLIEEVFNNEKVDLSVCGDWEEVQIEFGVLDKRLTPAPDFFGFQSLYQEMELNQIKKQQKLQSIQSKKKKNKRKMAKASRRKGKKKK